MAFDPISLGLLRRPGDYGADVAVAEGQSLGIPMQYGGPFLGIFACRNEFVRKMPGRLVGRTTDRLGRPCYVLTLQAREQHIRREKATSNICTNQGLLALRATVYLSLVGPQGLREAAELCCRKAHYAAERLDAVSGVKLAFPDRPFFKEFALRVLRRMQKRFCRRRGRPDSISGPSLSRFGTAVGIGRSRMRFWWRSPKNARSRKLTTAGAAATGCGSRNRGSTMPCEICWQPNRCSSWPIRDAGAARFRRATSPSGRSSR